MVDSTLIWPPKNMVDQPQIKKSKPEFTTKYAGLSYPWAYGQFCLAISEKLDGQVQSEREETYKNNRSPNFFGILIYHIT